MGEVQTQKYICKICSKSCVSGKSLGGHMRVHLALISASKRSGKDKSTIGMGIRGDHDQESCNKQSNSAFPVNHHCDSSKDSLGDGDQSSSYELRENPKKSWRISDPKCVFSKGKASCRECSKVFSSLRALSGHMRSHSIKNKEVHECKKCGKCFDSIRAMFGHMKSHSTRSKASKDKGDSLSDMDSLGPVRGKRSRISYKSTLVPSLSGSTAPAVSEVEDAAKCLMMLSSNERDCEKFDSVTESSDDDSAYFGAKSSSKRTNSSSDDTDFSHDGGGKIKTSLSLDDRVADSANDYTGKNVSEFDNIGSKFGAVDHEMEVGNEGQLWVGKVVEPDQSDEFAVELDCFRCSESAKCSKQHNKVLLGASERDEGSVEFFESDACPKGSLSFFVDECGLGKNSADIKATVGLEILNFAKEGEQKHGQTCDNVFNSCNDGMQHMQGDSLTMDTKTGMLSASAEADIKLDCSDNLLEPETAEFGVVSTRLSKSKEYECAICFRTFPTGQALGGHKRTHYTGANESKNKESAALNQEVSNVGNMLDLNYPMKEDEGTKSDCALNLWSADKGRERKATLVLTS